MHTQPPSPHHEDHPVPLPGDTEFPVPEGQPNVVQRFHDALDNKWPNQNKKYAKSLAAVEKYFAAKGLVVDPAFVLGPDRFEEALELVGRPPHFTGKGGFHGAGRSVICEDPELKDADAQRYVSGIAAHEAAHGAAGHEFDSFWHEAFADLLRVRFMQTQRQPWLAGTSYHVMTEARIRYVDEDIAYYVPPASEDFIDIPVRFAPLPGSAHTYSASGIAAYSLELLDQHLLPGLIDQMEQSCKDRGLRATVIERINGVQPGLYETLEGLRYSVEGFKQGLQLIKELLPPSWAAAHERRRFEIDKEHPLELWIVRAIDKVSARIDGAKQTVASKIKRHKR